MSKSGYFVQQLDSGRLGIFDAKTGVRIHYIGLQGWKLDSSPVIVGDRCSYMVRKGMRRRGCINKLPSGNLVTYFIA